MQGAGAHGRRRSPVATAAPATPTQRCQRCGLPEAQYAAPLASRECGLREWSPVGAEPPTDNSSHGGSEHEQRDPHDHERVGDLVEVALKGGGQHDDQHHKQSTDRQADQRAPHRTTSHGSMVADRRASVADPAVVHLMVPRSGAFRPVRQISTRPHRRRHHEPERDHVADTAATHPDPPGTHRDGVAGGEDAAYLRACPGRHQTVTFHRAGASRRNPLTCLCCGGCLVANFPTRWNPADERR